MLKFLLSRPCPFLQLLQLLPQVLIGLLQSFHLLVVDNDELPEALLSLLELDSEDLALGAPVGGLMLGGSGGVLVGLLTICPPVLPEGGVGMGGGVAGPLGGFTLAEYDRHSSNLVERSIFKCSITSSAG